MKASDNELEVEAAQKSDADMNDQQELTDISKCGPLEPGKKWVQAKKTESGMTADGSFFSKDYMVWEQVADNKVKNVKALG